MYQKPDNCMFAKAGKIGYIKNMSRGKRLTEEEKQSIREALESGMTDREVATQVKRSVHTVRMIRSRMSMLPANTTTIVTADEKKLKVEDVNAIQARLAKKAAEAATTLIEDMANMSRGKLDKMPLNKKAVAFGILVDKFRLLTEQSTDNLKSLNVVQIIREMTPMRSKDAERTDTDS